MIELLVVVSIIGVLATIVLSSLRKSREQSKVAKTVAEMRTIQSDVLLYNIDTGVFPTCPRSTCNITNDPFLNANGVYGWNGPYGKGLYNRSHAWKGMFTIQIYDHDGDLEVDTFILLDDDAYGSSSSDNSGIIPTDRLLQIDHMIDDGDLSTGRFMGLGAAGTSPLGEAVYLLDL